MKKYLFVSLLPILLLGARVDSIYLWDNDRGKYGMRYPAVGCWSEGGFLVWQDGRYSSFDIFGGRFKWPHTLSTEKQVNVDPYDNIRDIDPDVDAPFCPSYDAIYVWHHWGHAGIKKIVARREKNFNLLPLITIDSVGTDTFLHRPAVACRDNGDFIVSYTKKKLGEWPSIRYKRYYSDGSLIGLGVVRNVDSLHYPISRVAYCDSGFVIVYEDSSADGSRKSIYLQCRKVNGLIIKERVKVSYYGATDNYNEEEPDVAINDFGYGAVVWKDMRYGADTDIYGVWFQIRPGMDSIIISNQFVIDYTTNRSRYPRVTMLHQDPNAAPNNDFIVVWEEDTFNVSISDTTQIKGRVRLNNALKPKFIVNSAHYKKEAWPDISCRNSDTCLAIWANRHFEEIGGSTIESEDLSIRWLYRNPGSATGITFGSAQLDPIPSIIGGSKGWYYDDEDYDDPDTPWNEDPIDEPDSVYLDLDSAIVEQIEELNRNNQYRIFNRDTLPGGKGSLLSYDHLLIDLGFRSEGKTAGVISAKDRDAIVQYINSGKPVIVFGNDFGKMYNNDTLFKLFRANYLGDGAPYHSGNIDTLYGQIGTFARGETLLHTYKEPADNYVDSISPRGGAKLLLKSSGAPGKWYTGRAVCWGNYWKGNDKAQGSTIYCSFSGSGIKNRKHPHTYAEFIRRSLGFLKVACPPEPITVFKCSTGTLEGRVILRWRVVSDDSLGESAEGPYKLKFSRQKITSEDAFNSAEEYYQTWSTKDSTVGKWVRYELRGLPPMDTLIFALKVSDEDTLWSTLGPVPKVIVAGDSMTPHTITFGFNYVKDFSNKYEYLNRRRINDTGTDYDSLFVTWDHPYSPAWFQVGFARCNFNTEGDLFIYVDTKSGGADVTVPYNGSAGTSTFFKTATDSFRPDYCLIIENSSTHSYKRWSASKDGRGSWVDTTFTGTVVIDNVVNSYLYTELYIRYDRMGYTAGTPFKLMVLVQQETSNQIINAFPINNPLGTNKYLTQYYYWGSDGLVGGKVPARRQIIGIEEEQSAEILKTGTRKLEVYPNPCYGSLNLKFQIPDPKSQISIKIYDISGRLVRNFPIHHFPDSPIHQIHWDGTDDRGKQIAEGIYFCELKTEKESEVVKIIYIK